MTFSQVVVPEEDRWVPWSLGAPERDPRNGRVQADASVVLGHGQVGGERSPVGPAVNGTVHAAVVRQIQRVRPSQRIEDQKVFVDVDAVVMLGKGLSAVQGPVNDQTSEVDRLRIRGMHGDGHVVPALEEAAGTRGRELLPRDRPVCRTVHAQPCTFRITGLEARIDGLRGRRRDREVDSAGVVEAHSRRGIRPGRAGVRRLVDPLTVDGRVHDGGIRRVRHQIGGGAFEDQVPVRAAVGRAEEPVGGGRQHRGGARGPGGSAVDHHPCNARTPAPFTPPAHEDIRPLLLPGRTAVEGAQHPATVVAVPGKVLFACARVDDIGIHRIDRDGPHGQRTLPVREGSPVRPGVVRSPDSALRAARVQDVHVGGMDGDRRNPPRREHAASADPVGSERAPAGVGQPHGQDPARWHGPLLAERALEKRGEVEFRPGIETNPVVLHARQDFVVLLGGCRCGWRDSSEYEER